MYHNRILAAKILWYITRYKQVSTGIFYEMQARAAHFHIKTLSVREKKGCFHYYIFILSDWKKGHGCAKAAKIYGDIVSHT